MLPTLLQATEIPFAQLFKDWPILAVLCLVLFHLGGKIDKMNGAIGALGTELRAVVELLRMGKK